MYDTFQEQNVNLAINIFKGLDLKSPIDTEGIDTCQNWRFSQNGQLSRRPTYGKYNATSLGANPIPYIERIYIGANKYLIAVYTTTLKVGSDSAGTFSNLKTGLTDGTHYTGVTYKGWHYMGNGVDSNIKTNGLSATTDVMGATAPSSNPQALPSAAGSGNLSAAAAGYWYKWNWEYDSYQQSSVYSTPVSCATDGTHKAVVLYNFPAAPVNATHSNLYRTLPGGSIYYFHSRKTVGQLSGYGLSATGLIDNTADADLDTTVLAPTDNGTSPTAKFFKLHKERIFLAGNANNKSYVYYSDITGIVSYPDVFPANNYVPVSPDDGDDITGLAIDPTGYLCVFKKNSIRKLFTDGDPANWTLSEPFSRQGCWASYTIKETPQGIIYLSKDGWRIFDGQQSKFLSNSDKVNSIVRNDIMLARFDKCVGHYHNDTCYLSYTDRASNVSYNNRVLVYDMLTDNFITDTKNVDSYCTLGGADDWGEMYFGDSRNGFVYQEQITIGGINYSKLSDFRPNGTLSSLVVWNTEDDPYLELGGHFTLDRMNGSSFADFPTVTGLSGLDSLPSAYSCSGYYFSPPLLLNAKGYYYAYWNETLAENTDVSLSFRTSNTSAGLSGSWSSEYSTPVGSDISGLTSNDWLQFRITMSTFGLSASNMNVTPRIYKQGGYAVKLTYRVNSVPTENSILCDWRSPYFKLSENNEYARLRKLRIDHTGTTGLLSCVWNTEDNKETGTFNIDLASNPNTYMTPFPLTAYGRKIRLQLTYDNINDLTIKAINIMASPQPERFI